MREKEQGQLKMGSQECISGGGGVGEEGGPGDACDVFLYYLKMRFPHFATIKMIKL